MEKKKHKSPLKIRLNKNILISLIIIAIAIFGFSYYLSTMSFVAATVNGEKIYEKRIDTIYNSLDGSNKVDKKTILNRLIETKLFVQYIKSKGYYISDTEFQKELSKRLSVSNTTIANLVKELNLRGATLEDVRENMLVELFVNNVITTEIQITEEEISKYRSSNNSALSVDKIRDMLLQEKIKETISQIIQAQYKTANITIGDRYK